MKPKGLSGFTVCKNALSLDYCIKECIESMLPVCNEVVVGEMGSTDGTRELLDRMAAEDFRIRIVPIKDWTLERGMASWFVCALNEARAHLNYSHMLELDADEVLSDDGATREHIASAVLNTNAFCFDRLNFVRDASSLIPENECCGKYVCRIGPSHLWMPSDEPHARGDIHLLDMAYIQPAAKIYHLGFLRRRKAFFAKARVVLGAFFNEFDTRLAEAEAGGYHAFEKFPWWNRLASYRGYYPKSVRDWMTARGYEVPS